MESIATAVNQSCRHLSKLLVGLVLLLIFAGALVKSHEAGLSVPDWPTSYGYNMFFFPISEWRGGIFFEHTHRLLASAVGFLTLILTIWICRVERRSWVKILSVICLLAVVAQGVLGGLTVIYLLPAYISVAHAMLAQTFLLLTLLLAYSQSLEHAQSTTAAQTRSDRKIFICSLAALLVVYIQLFLGAVMRHLEAGLALLDFPSMGGFWLPLYPHEMLANANSLRAQIGLSEIDMLQMSSHLAHRLMALLVFAVLVFLCWLLSKSPRKNLQTLGWAIVCVLLLQISLGIVSVLQLREPISTSLHVLGGACLLGLAFIAALRTHITFL